MILLAAFLASATASQCALAILHLTLWLAALGVWRKVANQLNLELPAVALLTTLNLSGIVLTYFAAESGNPHISSPFLIPLLCALQTPPTSLHLSLLPSLTILTTGLLALRVTLSTSLIH
jgi:hypothetical protein